MINNLQTLLSFLQNYGYLAIFLITIIEGPLITMVAAFGASLGLFNVYIVLVLSVLGNLIGDMFFFLLGKFGGEILLKRYRLIKLNKNKIKRIESLLKTHFGKTLTVIKLTPGLPIPGIILAGIMKTSTKKFFIYSLIITFLFSLGLTLIGYFSGIAFITIFNHYKFIEILIAIGVIALIIIIILIQKISKIIANRIEKI